MKAFADLIQELESAPRPKLVERALDRYFQQAGANDHLWTIQLLLGKRPRRIIPVVQLKEWAMDASDLPMWLFERCYDMVKDHAEAAALLVPESTSLEEISLYEMMGLLSELKVLTDEERETTLVAIWESMMTKERYVFNKLLTGSFRASVSPSILATVLAQKAELSPAVISYILLCPADPQKTTWEALILSSLEPALRCQPYSFCLIVSLQDDELPIQNITEWQVERQSNGHRCQIVIRDRALHIWSSDNELITYSFPELQHLLESIEDGIVMECDIICHDGTKPLSAELLKSRLGSKKITKKVLEQAPIRAIIYDVLEYRGEDIQAKNLKSRRQTLEGVHTLVKSDLLHLSEVHYPSSWEEVIALQETCRDQNSPGLLLKNLSASYNDELEFSTWKFWKVPPLSIEAVLIYVERGDGFTGQQRTYTFAVWNEAQLVPICKSSVGLPDDEVKAIDAFVKKNTLEKFGPVKSIKPELVFELQFESVLINKRRKSGIELKTPIIQEWKKDIDPTDAGALIHLKKIVGQAD